MDLDFGRTDRFSELETVESDGYYFIASDNPG